MGTVRNILQAKGNAVHSVSPDTSVYDALESLEEKNVGALIVCDNGKLVGIFTERDYARKVILKGRSSKDTVVGDIMSDHPIYVIPDNTIEECMQVMTNKYIRHLPVLDRGELIGIISIGDVVKYMLKEKDFIIENLEHYITG
ncbi:CBS domain-containing protein [Chitinophagaceae bacterium LB-8]|uniref:CBS domain-containing protein n=1 Tax=Paraflavisolibacter caeni TaxID=2982496 RepID=A0A9X2XS94_9BACT|nr:CBS domain-containing protein [Paraflavisolibacter caeni]MCU7548089.1 CBS domain-containing protein [Paraflavisolibacter caeni]